MCVHIPCICPSSLVTQVTCLAGLSDPCPYIALLRSLHLSLTPMLKPKLSALESLAPSDAKESVDASDTPVDVCESPILDRSPAKTDGFVDPTPDEDETFDLSGQSPTSSHS